MNMIYTNTLLYDNIKLNYLNMFPHCSGLCEFQNHWLSLS